MERVYRFNKIVSFACLGRATCVDAKDIANVLTQDKKPTLFTKLGSIDSQPCGVGKEAGGVKYCAN